MNVVFTGYMGSGKTAVGNFIAEKYGKKFIDTDALVEEKLGMTIAEIFERFGEEYFRTAETAAIKTAANAENAVISTGGGAVLRRENIEILRKNGIVINLEPEEAVIAQRLSGTDSSRPLINGSSGEEILARFRKRQPYYDNCDIKVKVTAEKGIAETAEEIMGLLAERNGKI